jgi:beta-xylosidase
MKKLLILLLAGTTLAGTSQEKTYTNPVSGGIEAADPFVLMYNGIYYLYGTSSGDGFKYWTSKDLVDWELKGYAYRATANSWGKASFWAPEVVEYGDLFYMVYSAKGETMFGLGLRICLAVADHPGGPFTDLYAPLFDLGYSCIDGHIFIDEDGTPYLYYEEVSVVGEPWNREGYFWGTVMGVRLSNDLSRPAEQPTLCLYANQNWEGAESMHARSNEGMTVFKREGLYYMTYSGNHYADPNYGVGYATCEKPLGMWVKYENNPILTKDIESGVSGPGHNSVIKSPDRSDWFIVDHTH